MARRDIRGRRIGRRSGHVNVLGRRVVLRPLSKSDVAILAPLYQLGESYHGAHHDWIEARTAVAEIMQRVVLAPAPDAWRAELRALLAAVDRLDRVLRVGRTVRSVGRRVPAVADLSGVGMVAAWIGERVTALTRVVGETPAVGTGWRTAWEHEAMLVLWDGPLRNGDYAPTGTAPWRDAAVHGWRTARDGLSWRVAWDRWARLESLGFRPETIGRARGADGDSVAQSRRR